MQKMRVQVMLPFDTVALLNELTVKWRKKNLGSTIEELLLNFQMLTKQFNASQQRIEEFKRELNSWRDKK